MVVRRIILFALLAAAAVTGYLYYMPHKCTPSAPQAEEVAQETLPTTPEIPTETHKQIPVEQPAPPTPARTQQQPAMRMVTITNEITKKMITYHKALGSYTPKFSIEINGTPVEFGKQITVAAHNNSMDIKYNYNFLNGYRVGSRTTRVTLPAEGDAFTLTFSWKDDNHVIVSNAVAYAIIDEQK